MNSSSKHFFFFLKFDCTILDFIKIEFRNRGTNLYSFKIGAYCQIFLKIGVKGQNPRERRDIFNKIIYFILRSWLQQVVYLRTYCSLLLKKHSNTYLEHSHPKSSHYSILPSQNQLYHLYHNILQHSQHSNFYFPILLIKIIFLHNKIIYLTITIIYNTTHYLFFLSFSFC